MTLTVDSTLDAILAYDHPELIRRLEEKLGLSEERARELFEDVKKFLFICGTCDPPNAPPRRIDNGWHEFILFTKDYSSFCHRFFGRFIHHTPVSSTNAHKGDRASTRTVALAEQIFGDWLSANWQLAADADPCDACGPDACAPDCSNES